MWNRTPLVIMSNENQTRGSFAAISNGDKTKHLLLNAFDLAAIMTSTNAQQNYDYFSTNKVKRISYRSNQNLLSKVQAKLPSSGLKDINTAPYNFLIILKRRRRANTDN